MQTTVSPMMFVLGAFAFAVVLAMCVISLRGCLFAMAGLVGVAALGLPADWLGRLQPQWLEPIQRQRSPIFLALGIALTIGFLAHKQKPVRGPVAMYPALLIASSILASVLRVVHGDPVDGVLSLALLFSCMVVLIPILARVLEDAEMVRLLLRWFSVVSLAWCGAAAFQWLIDPSQLFASGRDRFLGVSANPQHAAVFLTISTGVSIWLGLNDPKRIWRYACGGIALVSVGMLLMTLSRTGMVMLLLMSVPVLSNRMGRAVIYLPFLAAGGAVAAVFVGTVTGGGFERLLSTNDTRTGVWGQLISLFLQSPLIGVGPNYEYAKVASENSLLVGLATYGLLMGVLVLAIWLAIGVQTIAVWKARPRLGAEYQRIAELIVGFNLALGAGSVFEGYFVGRIHTALIFACVFGSIGAWLLKLAAEGSTLGAGRVSTAPKPEIAVSGGRSVGNWGELAPG